MPCAFLKRDSPIDDGIADALGLLDQTPLAARDVRRVDLVVIKNRYCALLPAGTREWSPCISMHTPQLWVRSQRQVQCDDTIHARG